ncbi:MAG: sigma-70 family RNA polymerase sigma factor [Oscillospiraceae bacterium]|nr:sigma-70 family RNA polymerase sigma factor [Oscillospiraceae bacterium]
MTKQEFSRCIHDHEKAMYALAYGIVKNQEDAADVVQDAIVKAYTSLDSLRDPKLFKPWILRIVHNTAMSFLRGRRDTEDLEEQYDLAAPDPGVDQETRLTVWEAVNQLKMPYRLVLVLYYYDGCSVGHIAAITATPVAAVRQQLSRGRKMLAKLLNKEDFLR